MKFTFPLKQKSKYSFDDISFLLSESNLSPVKSLKIQINLGDDSTKKALLSVFP